MKQKAEKKNFNFGSEKQECRGFDYEYEDGAIDEDFAGKEREDDFDYDGERLHKYDEYTGKITAEIALVKFERLVRCIAKKYAGGGAEYEELFQLGQIELVRLVEKEENNSYLANYLRRRLARYISYHAERIRKEENRQNRVGLEAVANIVAVYDAQDWHERERVMFAKLALLLDSEEMELLCLIYAGESQRQAGEAFGVTHTAIQKRLEKIREKLAPLVPWLREKTQEHCHICDENIALKIDTNNERSD